MTGHDYPDDADGQALRRVADDESDMSQPMRVDFMIDVTDAAAARRIAAAASALGFETELVQEDDEEDEDGESVEGDEHGDEHDEHDEAHDREDEDEASEASEAHESLSRVHWTVYCTKEMVLTYASVTAVQAELDRIAGPLGGKSDGWGSFGNVDR